MEYKIREINLLKYNLIILFSLIFSIGASLILTSFLLRKTIRFLTNTDYSFLTFIITSLILCFIFIKLLKKYSTKNIEIILNKKELIFNNDRIFQIDNIEKFEIKTFMRNYPSFTIKMRNKERYKFYCKNKADDNFDNFVREFKKVTD